MAQDTYGGRDTRFGRSTAEEAKDMAGQQAQRIASQVEGAAHAVAEQGRKVQDNVAVLQRRGLFGARVLAWIGLLWAALAVL